MVMLYITRRQFEKKLSKFLEKEKPKPEEFQEFCSPVNSSHAADIYRRKTFNIQDEENNVNDFLLNSSKTLPQLSLPTKE
jgi:hypothetical protein